MIHIKSLETSRGIVEIHVSDNGPGIALEHQEHLFTKFYRPNTDSTLQVKGYGLGLYLSRYFANLHKGDISFISEPGKGTTFILKLPVSEDYKITEYQGGTYV